METVTIYHCTEENELFSEKENWHEKQGCQCNAKVFAVAKVGEVLAWSNGKEWGKIYHPILGEMMTYWNPERPCYETFTSPMINSSGEIIYYKFDQDEGIWDNDADAESLGLYNGIPTCRLG